MRRHPILIFLLLAMLFSWGFWVPVLLEAQGRIRAPFSQHQMQLAGAYGPALAAMIVALIAGGLDALRDLLRRLLVWRVGMLWYLVVLFLPALISLLNTALHTMFGGDAPNFAEPPVTRIPLPPSLTHFSPLGLMAPLFAYHLIFGTALGEELAWRGFLLQRLQQRHSALLASLWVGFCWVIWTLPLSWASPDPKLMLARFLLLLAGAMPASILTTWIYNGTGGSLLLVVLFNNAMKVTDLFLTPSAAGPIITNASFWIAALIVLRLAGPELGSKYLSAPDRASKSAGADSKLSPSIPS